VARVAQCGLYLSIQGPVAESQFLVGSICQFRVQLLRLSLWWVATKAFSITEAKRMQFVLFATQNGTYGSYSVTSNRIIIPVMFSAKLPASRAFA
jgi:hypothetical protein